MGLARARILSMGTSFSGHLEYGESEKGIERRRAPRVAHAVDLSYEIVSLPDEQTIIETLDKLLEAQSQDLSATGISLWTNRLLTPGTTIGLTIPYEGAQLSVKARVVWCQPQTEGERVRVRLGLEFVDMDKDIQAKIEEIVKKGESQGKTIPPH